jgi:hypothetical protein
MKHLNDRKSWAIAIVESLGILAFNAAFIPSFFEALGDQVSTGNVIIVSGGLFVVRILWFYVNLRLRLHFEKGGS